MHKAPSRPFHIRPGIVRDVPTILAMVRRLAEYERLSHEVTATPARLRRDGFGRRSYFQTLLCYRGGEPIGFALYHFAYSTFLARPTLYVEDIFILPGHRRQGAGKALLAALARIAVRKGCGRMEWIVLKVNSPGIRFYKRIGAGLRTEWILTRLTGAPLRRLSRWRGTPSEFRSRGARRAARDGRGSRPAGGRYRPGSPPGVQPSGLP
jgi:GNAT superfamily N-acetyltransferase